MSRHSTSRVRTRTSIKRSIIALSALAAAMAAIAPTAEAYSEATAGRPGAVGVMGVQGLHFDPCAGQRVMIGGVPTAYTCFSPWIVGTGPTAYRSRATRGTQVVASFYRLLRWDGSDWVVQATSQVSYTRLYARRRAVQLPRIDFLPKVAGQFRVLIAVAWRTTAGRSIGARVMELDDAGEYTCNTRFPCEVGSHWLWLRSPGT